MFKRAKYLVILSGFTSGLIIVILLLVYPFDTVIESFNSFVKYLISIAPSVILIVLGLLSGFLLAPLFYSKLETVE
jgi:cytochrome c biogenesis protein CcdA